MCLRGVGGYHRQRATPPKTQSYRNQRRQCACRGLQDFAASNAPINTKLPKPTAANGGWRRPAGAFNSQSPRKTRSLAPAPAGWRQPPLPPLPKTQTVVSLQKTCKPLQALCRPCKKHKRWYRTAARLPRAPPAAQPVQAACRVPTQPFPRTRPCAYTAVSVYAPVCLHSRSRLRARAPAQTRTRLQHSPRHSQRHSQRHTQAAYNQLIRPYPRHSPRHSPRHTYI